jgi:hypothetical protein
MKNPFKKEGNTAALIAYAALGAIVAGAITYLYLKRRSVLKLNEKERKEHAGDYLKHKTLKKKRTTDVHDLGKIVS